MAMKQCPTRDELTTYVRGKLPLPQADEVTEHVAACTNCEDTVHQLTSASDSLIDRIQAPPVAQPYVDEPACHKVVESVKRQTPQTPVTPRDGAVGRASAAAASEPARTMNRTEFVEFVTTVGFVTADELTVIAKQLSPTDAADVEMLAKALVVTGKLTKFQAANIYQGKGKALLYGDYLVLDRIGAGGMGQVFKARHRRMDRIVALKVLSTAAMKNADSVKRFEREVRAAAKLMHPNIVTAHDAGLQDGVHYLVMEYVEGPDLSSLVKKQGKLPIKQACEFIAQAARGFAFAHGKGIVHRDIKPGNLLVDKDGTVKVLDMGLARFEDGAVGSVMTEGELTQSGAVMGTVDYMAPEQAMNTRHADAKSDVYGLGCTLYRLLTAESVYGGQTMVEKILAHREQPIPSLREKRPEAPPALEALVTRMLSKKPDGRPSMQEIAETLTTLDSAPAIVPSATPVAAPVISAGLAPLAPVRGDGPGVRGDVSTAKPKTKGAAPPRKRSNMPLLAAAGAGAVLIAFGLWFIFRDQDGNETARVQLPDGGSVKLLAPGESPGVPQPGANSGTVAGPLTPGGSPGAKTAIAPQTTDVDPSKMFALPQSTGTVAPPSTTTTIASVAVTPPQPPVVAPIASAVPHSSGEDLWVYCDPTDQSKPGIVFDQVHYDKQVPWTIEAWCMPQITASMRRQVESGRESGFTMVALGLAFDRTEHLALQWVWRPTEKNVSSGVFRINNGGTILRLNDSPNDEPEHVAVTFNPLPNDFQRVEVWVNGQRESKGSYTVNANPAARLFSAGFINELRISKTIRYSEKFTPQRRFEPDADTLALYHCDEGAGDQLIDSGGRGLHAKLTNVKWAPVSGAAAAPIAIDAPSPGNTFPGPSQPIVDSPAVQAAAASAILKRGGWLYVAGKSSRVNNESDLGPPPFQIVEANLNKPDTTNDDLTILRGVATLTTVSIGGQSVTDEGLAAFAGHARLEEVNVAGPNVNGSGLRYLMNSPNIKVLWLKGSRIDDAGAANIAAFTKVETVGLDHSPVTSARFARTLTNLKSIDFNHTGIRDLSGLSGCLTLTNILANNTPLCDADLAPLKGLTQLERVAIYGTNVSDAVLATFEGMTQLKDLQLTNTYVTAAGVAKLQAKLPNCKITFTTKPGTPPILPPTPSLPPVAAVNPVPGPTQPNFAATPPTNVAVPAPQPVAYDPAAERQTALALLSRGCWLEVTVNDRRTKVPTPEQLPTGTFQITYLAITQTANFTEADFALLQNLSSVKEINSKCPALTDGALARFGNLTALEKISIEGSPLFTGTGLAYLSRLPNFKRLSLAGRNISDAGLANSLSQLTGLENLGVGRSPITNVNFVRAMSKLQILNLGESNIQDLSGLQGLPELQNINLWSTHVTDAAAAAVRSLPKIQTLSFSETYVTDACLSLFEPLTTLKDLNFSGAYVTADGAARLQAKLPNCKITVKTHPGTPPKPPAIVSTAAPTNPVPGLPQPTTPVAQPAGAIDLLALVQLPRDAVDGEWNRVGAALQGAGGNPARLQVPFTPPVAEYDLIFTGRRTNAPSEARSAILLGAVYAGKNFFWRISRTDCGLSDGDALKAPNYVNGLDNPIDVPCTIVCSVRRGLIRLDVNGITHVTYNGFGDDLKVWDTYRTMRADQFFLSVEKGAGLEVTSLKFMPVGAAQTSAPAVVASPAPRFPVFRLPAKAQSGLIGRMVVSKADVGLVITYQSGKSFDAQPIMDHLGAVPNSVVSGRAMKIVLSGVLHVPADMQVAAWHAGGTNSGGTNRLLVDGNLLGAVGDLKAKNTSYVVSLAKGEHAVVWELIGGKYGESVFEFFDAETLEPLTVYAPVELVTAAKSAPTQKQIDFTADPTIKHPPTLAAGATSAPTSTPNVASTSPPANPILTPSTFPASTPPPADRQPVPDVKDQAATLALIKDVYKDDYLAARVPDKKAPFATKLLQQATQAVDPIEKYVVLTEARAQAVDGDDPRVLQNVLTALVDGFEVDPAQTRVDGWKAMLAKSRPAPLVRTLYDAADKQFDAAVTAADFETAKKYADFAAVTAPRMSDAAVTKTARDRQTALAARQTEYAAAKTAVEKLATAPDDPEANAVVGRYRAVVEGDWPNALPLLAKGNEEPWKELATKSLSAAADGPSRAAVGDAWWDAAQAKPTQKAELTAAALYWYQASVGSLSGLTKTRIEKRIADAAPIVPQRKIPATPLAGDFATLRTGDTGLKGEVPQVFNVGGPASPPIPTTAQAPANATQNATLADPAFQQWLQQTAALSAEQQVTAVKQKLIELNRDNPGDNFEGILKERIQNGVLTGLEFNTSRVLNIAPCRVLTRVTTLKCNAAGRPSRLSDLTPLIGLSLLSFQCAETDVADLSPLRGMPLTYLNVQGTKVSDLSPLRGMPLQTLYIDETKVTDLTPLHDCKQLTTLNLRDVPVSQASIDALQRALPNCKITR